MYLLPQSAKEYLGCFEKLVKHRKCNPNVNKMACFSLSKQSLSLVKERTTIVTKKNTNSKAYQEKSLRDA